MGRVLIFISFLMLLGCGGGGSGTPSTAGMATPGTTPVIAPIAAGIYYGLDTFSNGSGTFPVVGAIDPSGNLRLAQMTGGAGPGCMGGTLTGTATTLNGTGTEFSAPASPGPGRSIIFGPGTLSVNAPGLPWSDATGTGTFTLAADSVYLEPLTPATQAGAYQSQASQNNLGSPITLTLLGDGTFSGTTSFGAFTGTMAVLTPGSNLCAVTLTATTARTAFTGLAFWSDQSPNLVQDALYLELNSPTYGLTAILMPQ